MTIQEFCDRLGISVVASLHKIVLMNSSGEDVSNLASDMGVTTDELADLPMGYFPNPVVQILIQTAQYKDNEAVLRGAASEAAEMVRLRDRIVSLEQDVRDLESDIRGDV